VRAEAVKVVAPGAGLVDAKVEFVERLGDRTLVYLRLADGAAITAEDAGTSRAAMGDAVGLALDGAAHLFDAEDRAHYGPASDWVGRMSAASPRKSSWTNGLFVTPYLVAYLVLLLYPLLAGVWLSLHKADLFGGEVFVGLENFGRLLRDTVFLQAVRNTFSSCC
jgi:hypothetical protein